MGSIDHYGNLWLAGRKNGRIKSGGENIYPEEVVEMALNLFLLYHIGKITDRKYLCLVSQKYIISTFVPWC